MYYSINYVYQEEMDSAIKTSEFVHKNGIRKAEEKAGQPGNVTTPSDAIFLHKVLPPV